VGWWRDVALDEEDRLSREEAGRVVRRSLRMLRPYRSLVVGALAVMVLFTLATLAGPRLIGYGIDHGLGKHRSRAALDRAALAYLAVALAALVLGRAQIVLVSRVGEQFLRDLRVRVFRHIQSMSMAFFDQEQTGRLVARMTSDIDALQDLIQLGLVQFVTNGLLFVITVAVLVVYSPLLFLVCLISVPPLVIATRWFRRESNTAYLTVRDRISQTMSTLQEGIAGIRVIKAFGRQRLQAQRFSEHNDAQLHANVRAIGISARYFPVVETSTVVTTAAVVGLGGVLVHQHRTTLGTVAAFVLYLSYLFDPIQQLSQLFNLVQSSGAALAKLFGLLDTPSAVQERPGAVDLPARGAIDVRGVGFAYGEGPMVLRGVGLSIVPGERLALVGPTGAGKSTLAKLVARLYDPTEGSISMGGTDLRDATFRSLRERIVVVPQEGFLFHGTILDNVRIGRDGATDDDVRRAMETIGVLDHFAGLHEGLATEVRERGSRLSAGERQLVSLARAALANPSVLVLDEATSNLDPGTEAEVERAVTALMEGRTVIVIAHRLSTAARADRVAVIDEGGLLELGTHRELLDRGGRYAALFASWTGGQGDLAAVGGQVEGAVGDVDRAAPASQPAG
jgi:ATP-binding cassette subfamily B protein